MPVPAVIIGGMPTVSSGSQIVTFGIISGWKMTFLVCVASSVMTPARPTSEPVPAVVGTATMGSIPLGSARVHQSPTSSKSHIGRFCPAMKAITLPASSAEPPPIAMTPSCLPPLSASRPASMVAAAGLGFTSENTCTGRLAPTRMSLAALIIGSLTSPRSVTISGRVMPAAAAASPSSFSRPAPIRTEVG